MDREFHVDTALGQHVVEFAHFVLSLCHRHAVAGHNDHRVGRAKNRGGFLGSGTMDRADFLRCGGRNLHLAERSEQHVCERSVHGLRHDHRQNESGRTVERARDDEQFAVDDETHGRRRKAGVRIE